MSGSPRDLEETAIAQIKRLGYAPEEVKHIVLTHFHYDHVGGLPDFPQAKVHIYKDEYEAVTQPQDMYERLPLPGRALVARAGLGDTFFARRPLVRL